MRKCMKTDGWVSNPQMPEMWLFKRSGHNLFFIDPEGNIHSTRESAVKSLIVQGKKEESQHLLNFCENMRRETTKNQNIVNKNLDESWIKDDPSVPSGWMIKTVKFGSNNVTKLLSPNGHMIQGRRLALQFMIKGNYSEEQISEMRSCLKFDGWSSSPALPPNWLYKITKDGTSFLDSSGEYYRNKDKALQSLSEINRSTEYDLLSAFKTKSRDNKKSSSSDDWKEFDPEPLAGWKYKEDAPGHTRYLSPSGDYLKGKNHLMKFLLHNKFSKDTISAMRSSFKSDGWTSDPGLPRFWMRKKTHGHGLLFLSPEGAILRSKEEAVAHIKKHVNYQNDVDLILSFRK